MTAEKGPDHGSEQLTHKQAVERALNDPAARAARADNPHVVQARQLYEANASSLLAELTELGLEVESVGELARRRLKYQVAVPVLLRWLPQVSYLPLAEDIVRTLSVSFAKKAALSEFLKMFRQPPDVEDPMRPATSELPIEHLRWVFGNGLGIFAGPTAADDLLELALDRRFGQARTQIVLNLPKTKDDRAAEALLSLLDDPTVSAFAIEALGKMRHAPARGSIAGMLDHSDKNVRDQARKALKRIDG